MNKLYRYLALLTLPLFTVRVVHALFYIDPQTGFFSTGNRWLTIVELVALFAAVVWLYLTAKKTTTVFSGSKATLYTALLFGAAGISAAIGWFMQRWLHIVALVVVAAAIAWIYHTAKKTKLASAGPQQNTYAALFFGAAGISVAIGSVMQLLGALQQAPFSYFFKPKQALFDMGFLSTHFRIEFWCSLFGYAAAVWFIWAAFRLGKSGSLKGSAYFSSVPVLWYIMRTLTDFSVSTVNPNNTLMLTSLATDLILAFFILRYVWIATLRYPDDNIPGLAPFALLALVFVVSFKTPLILIALQAPGTDLLLLLSDTFVAIGGFLAAGQLLAEKNVRTGG